MRMVGLWGSLSGLVGREVEKGYLMRIYFVGVQKCLAYWCGNWVQKQLGWVEMERWMRRWW